MKIYVSANAEEIPANSDPILEDVWPLFKAAGYELVQNGVGGIGRFIVVERRKARPLDAIRSGP